MWIYCRYIYCIIVSLWSLKSLSFAFIHCATHCHSFYHLLSFVFTRFHSLSYHGDIMHLHGHTLSLVVPLVVLLVIIRCTTCCHLLSLVVTRCTTSCYWLSLVVTRYTTHLSFHKHSGKSVYMLFNLFSSRSQTRQFFFN